MFALYLVLGATTYAFWSVWPVLALALFLACAVVHFAEDWGDMDDRLLALGTAAALLTSPALLHKEEIRAIFVVVTGVADGALLAEFMRAMAPVALGLAITGILGLIRSRRPQQAACCGLLLTAMVVFPPLAAFALFFCLYHSPHHLREAWTSVPTGPRRRLAVGLALTAASLGIAALLVSSEGRGSLPDGLVAATFMTFSVLTVPHMLVPLMVRRWRLLRKLRERGESFGPASQTVAMSGASSAFMPTTL